MPTMPSEFKSHFDNLKTMIAELPSKDAVTRIQAHVDLLDAKMQTRIVGDSSFGAPSLVEQLKSNEDVSRLLRDKKGTAILNFDAKTTASIMQYKTVLTESGQGFQTTGVLPIDRLAGITPEARQTLTIRDVLTARPTASAVVDFVKVSSPLSIASPAAEASTRAENAIQFTSSSERIKTIATWLPATRQILDDLTELNGFIMSSLPFYVALEEELQLLAGDGTGENLHGLLVQASSFNTSLLSAARGWNKVDIVGRAIQQITSAKEIQPTFVVLHPNDWYDIRLTKDNYGRYILGDPQSMVRPNILGLFAVSTTSIAPGTFLVGSGDPVAAEIRDRGDLQLEISNSHSDFFTRGQVAIRCERRLALVVKRGGSFVQGSFSTSP